MHTIWLSLAWKEWHEHKWKLVSTAAVMCGVATVLLLDGDHDVLAGVRLLLALCIVPMAIFIGLGDAAGERSRGTMPFLRAVPVPMWLVAVNKALFGFITLVGAILIAMLYVYFWATARSWMTTQRIVATSMENIDPFSIGSGNWYCDTVLALLCVGISFYIWTIACSVNRKDEISGGAVSLLIMVLWTVGLIVGLHWLVDRSADLLQADKDFVLRGCAIAVSTVPGGIVAATEIGGHGQFLGVAFATAACVHIGLGAWYLWRFGRISNVAIRSPQNAKRRAGRTDWLGPPRGSALTAIAWKQFRESGPIVVAGLAGTIGIVAVTGIIEWLESGNASPFGQVYFAVAIVLGFVMAVVIGIGTCFYDMQPRLNMFWRSRPINVDLWFWCKYATGLAVLLAATYLPIVLIAVFGDRSGLNNFHDVYTIPIGQAAVFASAVAMTCLVRHAVYAAILSIGFVYAGILLAFTAWSTAALIGWADPNPRIWWDPTLLQMATGLMTSVVISTVIAWMAMRYDWGRKSRY